MIRLIAVVFDAQLPYQMLYEAPAGASLKSTTCLVGPACMPAWRQRMPTYNPQPARAPGGRGRKRREPLPAVLHVNVHGSV